MIQHLIVCYISTLYVLALPRGCLQFVIVVFPNHTHLLFLSIEVFVTACVVNSAKYFVKGYIIKTLITL